ncbi:MAG TPA: DNA polymerase III subunit chi [Steroidobacteraceae bacterium]|nr:DNA polymerase III subunit chi [Steroidobacteraceae bacterium]
MTGRVDFYLLRGADPRQRWTFACRLAEKIYLRDLRAVILANSMDDARALDILLWTFDERSFVPHALCDGDAAAESGTPVHLTADPAHAPAADVLVNLSDRLPDGPQRFARIAEIVDGDAARRALARERYKVYREIRVQVTTHPRDDPGDG